MAKKGNTAGKQTPAPVGKPQSGATVRAQVAPKENKPNLFVAYKDAWWAFAIGLFTYLILKVSLDNNFTNWDDPGYVVNQPIIKDLSGAGLSQIFSTAIMGNYHPLTMLSYAIDYSISGLNPFSYHFQSLLFHVATTVLVYFFVLLLTRKPMAAIVCGFLFGIHPMHIESVAWVAGRKDVVYGFFYMAACIAWVYYTRAVKAGLYKWYGAVVLLFLCSVMAKPVAVSLPVTLLAIDYFERRSLNVKLLLEKIPFFLISVGFGVKSLFDQRVFGALGTQGETFNPIERLGLGGYALITYLWKAVLPIKLLCFYPYPLKVGGSLEALYYIYPLITAGLIFVLFRFFRKDRAVMFGVFFFMANIALLLQFIPVGGAIIADRYSYIPYMGLFFILGYKMDELAKGENKGIANFVFGAFMGYVAFLSYLSNERCKVWYDGMSLWRDEIEVEPVRAPNGYNNLGFFYFNKFYEALDPNERRKYFDSSYFLLNRAIQLQPKFVNPYVSLAELLRTSAQYNMVGRNIEGANRDFAAAKQNYYRALSLDTTEQAANAYVGLAILYCVTGNYDSAQICFVNTFRLKPYNPEAHSNYANFFDMQHKYDSALVHYGIALQQNPDFVASYLNRGRALERLNRCPEAMKDFNKAIDMQPELAEAYYARAICFAKSGNRAAAIQDIDKARSMGYNQIDPSLYQSLKQ